MQTIKQRLEDLKNGIGINLTLSQHSFGLDIDNAGIKIPFKFKGMPVENAPKKITFKKGDVRIMSCTLHDNTDRGITFYESFSRFPGESGFYKKTDYILTGGFVWRKKL